MQTHVKVTFICSINYASQRSIDVQNKVNPKDLITKRQLVQKEKEKEKKDNPKDPTKCIMQLKELLGVQKQKKKRNIFTTMFGYWRCGVKKCHVRMTITSRNAVDY